MTKTDNMKRERSKNKILIALKKEDKRFTDLQKETELSPAGLNGTLKMLMKEDIIRIILDGKKRKYRLTKNGERWFEKHLYLSYDVDLIKSREGKHYRDFSTLHDSIISLGFEWGIESDLTVDKDIDGLHLLKSKDVIEIEELIYKKIKNNIKKENIEIKNGKGVLGFRIDYNEIIKSIKQKSLEYVNHMSKEELRILSKYEDDPESVTKNELEKLSKLRKKTYKKIKNIK